MFLNTFSHLHIRTSAHYLSIMKYTNEIIINKPIDRVIELFDNTDNLKKWMPGLVSFEHLSGEPGQVGAKSKMVFKQGKKETTMIETVTVRDLPHEFSGTYELPGIYNEIKNFFSPIDGNTTLYKSETEFKFRSMVMKLIAFLMPGAFKKESQKYLEYFKKFAEEN